LTSGGGSGSIGGMNDDASYRRLKITTEETVVFFELPDKHSTDNCEEFVRNVSGTLVQGDDEDEVASISGLIVRYVDAVDGGDPVDIFDAHSSTAEAVASFIINRADEDEDANADKKYAESFAHRFDQCPDTARVLVVTDISAAGLATLDDAGVYLLVRRFAEQCDVELLFIPMDEPYVPRIKSFFAKNATTYPEYLIHSFAHCWPRQETAQ